LFGFIGVREIVGIVAIRNRSRIIASRRRNPSPRTAATAVGASLGGSLAAAIVTFLASLGSHHQLQQFFGIVK
jgi:hypothetical protein